MRTKAKMTLSAVFTLGLLGSTLPALAEKDYELLEPYGGPTQSWQDIARSRQDVQRQIQRQYHQDGSAYGYSVPPAPKHRPLHKHVRDR
jgi:hypothetical protein